MSKKYIINRKEEKPQHFLKQNGSKSSDDLPARHPLMGLHGQLGNQTMQHVLSPFSSGVTVQRRENEEEHLSEAQQLDSSEAKKPAEVGEIEISKAEVKHYEVKADNVDEAIQQVEDKTDWCEYEYEYDVKVDKNGVVEEVNVEVKITVHLPEWRGPGWEHASPQDKAHWLGVINSFGVNDNEIAEDTELPQQWLLGAEWEDAPKAIKGNWLSTLQDIQKQEKGYLDVAYRRALVLQQRLFNQPEKELNAIFDEFLKDIESETEIYEKQFEVGKNRRISLGNQAIVQ